MPFPVTGNVMLRFKTNNNNQEIYIENVILPIASVTHQATVAIRSAKVAAVSPDSDTCRRHGKLAN